MPQPDTPTYRTQLGLKPGTTTGQVIAALQELISDAADPPHETVTIVASADRATTDLVAAIPQAGTTLHYPQGGSHENWEIPEDTFGRGLLMLASLMAEQDAERGWYARSLTRIDDGPLERLCRMMSAEWVRAMTAYPTRPDVSPPEAAQADARAYLKTWGLMPEDVLARTCGQRPETSRPARR